MDKQHWLDEWKLIQCYTHNELSDDGTRKCLTPDGFVHCDSCRYLTKRYAHYYHAVV